MSWFSKNYEKAALGGAVLTALGLAYLGWSKFGGVDADFGTGLKGSGNDITAIPGAEAIPMALQSLKIDRTWDQALDGDRPVDLFTGIAIFLSRSAPEKPVDLLKDEPVHAPIPNTWWIDNRLDPGFADSAERDPDADGFTNLEEYTAKTDPNSDKSHPALIAKLKFHRDESLVWVLRPSFGSDGKFPFTFEDSKGGRNKVSAAEMIGPGEVFFTKEPMKNRFKMLGSEERVVPNPRTKENENLTIVKIEDQRPNKKGTVYEFPSPLQDDDRKNKHLKYDRSAVLSLEAIGSGGTEFVIEENTAFALPQGGEEKKYFLKTVTPDSITVEFPQADGSRRTVEIRKGSFPDLSL